MAPPALAYPRPGTTERVSLADDEAQGNLGSTSIGWSGPSMSADGRLVAFASFATNLVAGDGNDGQDAFVRDRVLGTTEVVSVSSSGAQGDGDSWDPAISLSGRYVAFRSDATNLAPHSGSPRPTEERIYRHDRATGHTEFVGFGSRPSISGDGRFVGYDTIFDAFVWDGKTGVTESIHLASDGSRGTATALEVSLSADGQKVAFTSDSPNLDPADGNSTQDVFVHDRETGRTELVSISTEGTPGNSWSRLPAISGSGTHVAFWADATNLVPSQGLTRQIYVRDLNARTTEVVSVSSSGVAHDGWGWGRPALSADGRYVAFRGSGANLVPGDLNGDWDVFVRDRLLGTTEILSVSSGGDATPEGQFNHTSSPAMTPDGRLVAFESLAPNLVDDDTNNAWDVFLRDRRHALGIVPAEAVRTGDGVRVRGWVRFAGVVAADVRDHPDDSELGRQVGGDIKRAMLLQRPEEQDLALRLVVSNLPGVRGLDKAGLPVTSASGFPALVYGLRFTSGGVTYEARAGGSAELVEAGERPFALYRCATECELITGLSGAVGTTGNEIWISIPLSLIGGSSGASLTDASVFAAYGTSAMGKLRVTDTATLGSALIAVPTLDLGLSDAETDPADVTFGTRADPSAGRFDALVSGNGEVAWAKACLGATCAIERIAVT